jgi:FKBP-type peptidyl-prolyl cis-trans isomerase FklB
MKHITNALVQASSLYVLMAVAPFAGAQAPAPTAPTPPPPGLGAPPTPAAEAPADTSIEHTSYLFGLTFAEQLHNVGVAGQVDQDAIQRGVKDGLQGKKSTRTDQQQLQAFVRSVMAEALARNQAAAKDFLEKNGHEKGVKTTADGLQYKVLSPGNAKAPLVQSGDQVTVQYRGKLLDGSEFDSSYAHGAPATFNVNGVIKGWQEALLLMKPGAKWQLFVPPELAYDKSPRPGIPPGSLLLFEVELVSAKHSESPPAADSPPGTPPAHRPGPPVPPAASPAPPNTGSPPPPKPSEQ